VAASAATNLVRARSPRKARGWIVERASARGSTEFETLRHPAFFSHDEPAKIALALASIWPFIGVLIFFLFLFGTIFFMSFNLEHDGHGVGPLTLPALRDRT
jgi:hypothetical protein